MSSYEELKNQPKVSACHASRAISQSHAFKKLSTFLTNEIEKASRLDLPHWEDLFLVAESMVDTEEERYVADQLRMKVPATPSFASPSAVGGRDAASGGSIKQHVVFKDHDDDDDDDEKVVNKSSDEPSLSKSERKAKKKAAKEAKKAAKKAKKEQKKKRKRESSD